MELLEVLYIETLESSPLKLSALDTPNVHIIIARSIVHAKCLAFTWRIDLVMVATGHNHRQGVTLLMSARAAFPDKPILALATNREASLHADLLHLGADEVMVPDLLLKDELYRRMLTAIERGSLRLSAAWDQEVHAQKFVNLRHEAETDSLTGLPNRRGLQMHLSRNRQCNVAVAVLDIDDLKKINDMHGLAAGDVTLRHFAVKLRTLCADGDFACRVGGDEFVLILAEKKSDNCVDRIQKFINQLGARPFRWQGHNIHMSATAALEYMNLGFMDLEALFIATRTLLSDGKHNGKGRVVTSGSPGYEASLIASEALVEPGRWERASFRLEATPLVWLRDFGLVGHQVRLGAILAMVTRRGGCLAEKNVVRRLVRLAAAWVNHPGNQSMIFIHMENVPLTTEMTEQLLAGIFQGEMRSRFCFFFPLDCANYSTSDLWRNICRLRRAGFQIGAVGIGEGATSLETLYNLSPSWILLGAPASEHALSTVEGLNRLRFIVGCLASLDARLVAFNVRADEHLQVLVDLGIEVGTVPNILPKVCRTIHAISSGTLLHSSNFH